MSDTQRRPCEITLGRAHAHFHPTVADCEAYAQENIAGTCSKNGTGKHDTIKGECVYCEQKVGL